MKCPNCGNENPGDRQSCQECGAVLVDERRSVNDDPTLRSSMRTEFLNRYRVLGECGSGGMGVVYRCKDKISGIEVALKALPLQLCCNSGEMEEVRANFQLVSKLAHPNIATVRTLEQDPETEEYYLILELVVGDSLRRWKAERGGHGTPQEVIPLLRQAAQALDYAHNQKIIHRDIKPGNMMITKEGTVKVLDFGLAAQIQSSLSRVSQAIFSTSGTGPYMAPEQWRGQRQDGKTDQYALAAMAYELLCGNPPFDSTDQGVLKRAVLEDAPQRPEGMSDVIWRALRRSLSKDREQRFDNCVSFVDAMDGKLPPRPPAGWKKKMAIAMAAVAIAAAGMLVFVLTPPHLTPNQMEAIKKPFLSEKKWMDENMPVLLRIDGLSNNIAQADHDWVAGEHESKSSAKASNDFMSFSISVNKLKQVVNEQSNAAAAQKRVVVAEEKARAIDAAEKAGRVWNDGQLQFGLGRTNYGKCLFPEATTQFEAAEKLFAQAERESIPAPTNSKPDKTERPEIVVKPPGPTNPPSTPPSVVVRLSTNANLANLSASAGVLSPGFSSDILQYALSVPPGAGTLAVTPRVDDSNASVHVQFGGNAPKPAVSGQSTEQFPLLPGANTIVVTVTSQSKTTRNYIINAVQSQSANADLAGLIVSAGSLSPSFVPQILQYTVNVPPDVTNFALTPNSGDSNATLQVQVRNDKPNAVVSGQPTAAISLNPGANVLSVIVTSQCKTNIKTYAINAMVEQSGDADLAGLSIKPGELSPPFNKAITQYNVALSNEPSLTVTPFKSQARAFLEIRVDGGAATRLRAETPSISVPLNSDKTLIGVKVTAEIGTEKTYELHVKQKKNQVEDCVKYFRSMEGVPKSRGAAEEQDFEEFPSRFTKDNQGGIYDSRLKVTWIVPQSENMFRSKWKDAEKNGMADNLQLPTLAQLSTLVTFKPVYRDGRELYINTNFFYGPYTRSISGGFRVWAGRRARGALLPDATGEYVSLSERIKGDNAGHDDEVANVLFIRQSPEPGERKH